MGAPDLGEVGFQLIGVESRVGMGRLGAFVPGEKVVERDFEEVGELRKNGDGNLARARFEFADGLVRVAQSIRQIRLAETLLLTSFADVGSEFYLSHPIALNNLRTYFRPEALK